MTLAFLKIDRSNLGKVIYKLTSCEYQKFFLENSPFLKTRALPVNLRNRCFSRFLKNVCIGTRVMSTAREPVFIRCKFLSSVVPSLFTAQKMKFFIKDFFSKCDQIRSVLFFSHLLKKFLMKDFIFLYSDYRTIFVNRTITINVTIAFHGYNSMLYELRLK